MFDLTSSKLLILAVVALIVVGPKDLPALLRTIGRYVGMVRRQAEEFRRQFDDAIRESEFADIKKELQQFGDDTSATLHKATESIENDMKDLNRDIDDRLKSQTTTSSHDDAASSSHDGAAGDPGAAASEAVSSLPQPPVPAAPRPVDGGMSTDHAAADASAEPVRGGV
ncbi:MAG: Sec-independent protein translocase protein TatB [Hyphomicrobiaceae bacterium]